MPVIDLADMLCGPGRMRRIGQEWAARCPLPDHEDRSPSFTVNPEKNLFWCFGCLRGGGVIELARFAWEFEKSEAPMAAAYLLRQFGHEIPARPDSWFRKNARQASMREAIRRQRVEVLRRRLFRVVILPLIKEWTDASDRRAEVEAAWRDFQSVPVETLLNRIEDGS
ncbi:MAG: CHC2 zinc finger domain-containing protein [Rubrobacteraceae bacterium]